MIDDLVLTLKQQQQLYETGFLLALETDEDFVAWYQQHSGMEYPPIVRASTYKKVWKWQEFCESYIAPKDPRRPVVMRGARAHMKRRRFDNRRSYAHEVTLRYLNKIRFDGSNKREINRVCALIFTHMQRRGISHCEHEIRNIVGAEHDKLMECHQLRVLTNTFKRVLKAPEDRQRRMAEGLIAART